MYDRDLECLVPKYGRNYHDTSELRSDLPSPAVGGRCLKGEIRSMADGRVYETFRNYEKSVRRAGAEIVGPDKHWQDHIKPQKPYGGDKAHEASVVGDVKRAIEEVATRKPARIRYRGKRRAA